MEQRPLGRSGRTIGALMLGSVTFGREIDQDEAYRVMDYAVERGVTTFDTAEQYGGGQARARRARVLGYEDSREVSVEMSSAERIMGRWLRSSGSRDAITLCTKVSTGGGPQNIAAELGRSLDRLQTDRLDVYYLHVPDPGVPVAETLDALTAEVREGRVGVIGCSNHSAAQVREALDASEAHGYERYEIVQPPYSLANPEAEGEIFPLCRAEGLAVATYSPLAAGLLTGLFGPSAAKLPPRSRFHVAPDYMDLYFSQRSFAIVERLRAKASEAAVPMARLAMAWAMTHPDVTSVVVGADTPEQLDQAIAAYEMGLDTGVRREMSDWLAGRPAAG